MTEKNKPSPSIGAKPVPMKLFATWEVDRTPSNCIPRLCSLTLTRLVIFKSFGSDVASIYIAVKMQGSKRTLRSNEMVLPQNGLLDTELILNFSLQNVLTTSEIPSMMIPAVAGRESYYWIQQVKHVYHDHVNFVAFGPSSRDLFLKNSKFIFSLLITAYPHFLKRDGNKLHVMLQRKKRYKNRTILGYKTLANGTIVMSQVLQKQAEMELDLLSDTKESKGGCVAARVSVTALSSQPVDYEVSAKSHQINRRVSRIGDFSDEDEDFSSNDEGSDSEPMLDDHRVRKNSIPPSAARQRNLKQKFISLLKRFRVNEDQLGLDADREAISSKLSGGDMDAAEIEDLFEELDLSDSGPEIDTMSVTSTPKPSLRPFFSSSQTLLNDPFSATSPGKLAN